MEIGVDEALLLIAHLSEETRRRRDAFETVQAQRDRLFRLFDGQEGMGRTAMADAAGLTRARVFAILQRDRQEHEAFEEGVTMPDELRDALVDVFGHDWPSSTGPVHLDVEA